MEKERRCKVCGELKPLKEFHRNSHCKEGRTPECAACINKRQRARYRTSMTRTGGLLRWCTPEEIQASAEEMARIKRQEQDAARRTREAAEILHADRLEIAGR